MAMPSPTFTITYVWCQLRAQMRLKVNLGPTLYAVSSESITGLLVLAFVLLHSTMLSRKNPALLQGVRFDTPYYTALPFETHLLPSTRVPGICITF